MRTLRLHLQYVYLHKNCEFQPCTQVTTQMSSQMSTLKKYCQERGKTGRRQSVRNDKTSSGRQKGSSELKLPSLSTPPLTSPPVWLATAS